MAYQDYFNVGVDGRPLNNNSLQLQNGLSYWDIDDLARIGGYNPDDNSEYSERIEAQVAKGRKQLRQYDIDDDYFFNVFGQYGKTDALNTIPDDVIGTFSNDPFDTQKNILNVLKYRKMYNNVVDSIFYSPELKEKNKDFLAFLQKRNIGDITAYDEALSAGGEDEDELGKWKDYYSTIDDGDNIMEKVIATSNGRRNLDMIKEQALKKRFEDIGQGSKYAIHEELEATKKNPLQHFKTLEGLKLDEIEQKYGMWKYIDAQGRHVVDPRAASELKEFYQQQLDNRELGFLEKMVSNLGDSTQYEGASNLGSIVPVVGDMLDFVFNRLPIIGSSVHRKTDANFDSALVQEQVDALRLFEGVANSMPDKLEDGKVVFDPNEQNKSNRGALAGFGFDIAMDEPNYILSAPVDLIEATEKTLMPDTYAKSKGISSLRLFSTTRDDVYKANSILFGDDNRVIPEDPIGVMMKSTLKIVSEITMGGFKAGGKVAALVGRLLETSAKMSKGIKGIGTGLRIMSDVSKSAHNTEIAARLGQEAVRNMGFVGKLPKIGKMAELFAEGGKYSPQAAKAIALMSRATGTSMEAAITWSIAEYIKQHGDMSGTELQEALQTGLVFHNAGLVLGDMGAKVGEKIGKWTNKSLRDVDAFAKTNPGQVSANTYLSSGQAKVLTEYAKAGRSLASAFGFPIQSTINELVSGNNPFDENYASKSMIELVQGAILHNMPRMYPSIDKDGNQERDIDGLPVMKFGIPFSDTFMDFKKIQETSQQLRADISDFVDGIAMQDMVKENEINKAFDKYQEEMQGKSLFSKKNISADFARMAKPKIEDTPANSSQTILIPEVDVGVANEVKTQQDESAIAKSGIAIPIPGKQLSVSLEDLSKSPDVDFKYKKSNLSDESRRILNDDIENGLLNNSRLIQEEIESSSILSSKLANIQNKVEKESTSIIAKTVDGIESGKSKYDKELSQIESEVSRKPNNEATNLEQDLIKKAQTKRKTHIAKQESEIPEVRTSTNTARSKSENSPIDNSDKTTKETMTTAPAKTEKVVVKGFMNKVRDFFKSLSVLKSVSYEPFYRELNKPDDIQFYSRGMPVTNKMLMEVADLMRMGRLFKTNKESGEYLLFDKSGILDRLNAGGLSIGDIALVRNKFNMFEPIHEAMHVKMRAQKKLDPEGYKQTLELGGKLKEEFPEMFDMFFNEYHKQETAKVENDEIQKEYKSERAKKWNESRNRNQVKPKSEERALLELVNWQMERRRRGYSGKTVEEFSSRRDVIIEDLRTSATSQYSNTEIEDTLYDVFTSFANYEGIKLALNSNDPIYRRTKDIITDEAVMIDKLNEREALLTDQYHKTTTPMYKDALGKKIIETRMAKTGLLLKTDIENVGHAIDQLAINSQLRNKLAEQAGGRKSLFDILMNTAEPVVSAPIDYSKDLEDGKVTAQIDKNMSTKPLGNIADFFGVPLHALKAKMIALQSNGELLAYIKEQNEYNKSIGAEYMSDEALTKFIHRSMRQANVIKENKVVKIENINGNIQVIPVDAGSIITSGMQNRPTRIYKQHYYALDNANNFMKGITKDTKLLNKCLDVMTGDNVSEMALYTDKVDLYIEDPFTFELSPATPATIDEIQKGIAHHNIVDRKGNSYDIRDFDGFQVYNETTKSYKNILTNENQLEEHLAIEDMVTGVLAEDSKRIGRLMQNASSTRQLLEQGFYPILSADNSQLVINIPVTFWHDLAGVKQSDKLIQDVFDGEGNQMNMLSSNAKMIGMLHKMDREHIKLFLTQWDIKGKDPEFGKFDVPSGDSINLLDYLSIKSDDGDGYKVIIKGTIKTGENTKYDLSADIPTNKSIRAFEEDVNSILMGTKEEPGYLQWVNPTAMSVLHVKDIKGKGFIHVPISGLVNDLSKYIPNLDQNLSRWNKNITESFGNFVADRIFANIDMLHQATIDPSYDFVFPYKIKNGKLTPGKRYQKYMKALVREYDFVDAKDYMQFEKDVTPEDRLFDDAGIPKQGTCLAIDDSGNIGQTFQIIDQSNLPMRFQQSEILKQLFSEDNLDAGTMFTSMLADKAFAKLMNSEAYTPNKNEFVVYGNGTKLHVKHANHSSVFNEKDGKIDDFDAYYTHKDFVDFMNYMRDQGIGMVIPSSAIKGSGMHTPKKEVINGKTYYKNAKEQIIGIDNNGKFEPINPGESGIEDGRGIIPLTGKQAARFISQKISHPKKSYGLLEMPYYLHTSEFKNKIRKNLALDVEHKLLGLEDVLSGIAGNDMENDSRAAEFLHDLGEKLEKELDKTSSTDSFSEYTSSQIKRTMENVENCINRTNEGIPFSVNEDMLHHLLLNDNIALFNETITTLDRVDQKYSTLIGSFIVDTISDAYNGRLPGTSTTLSPSFNALAEFANMIRLDVREKLQVNDSEAREIVKALVKGVEYEGQEEIVDISYEGYAVTPDELESYRESLIGRNLIDDKGRAIGLVHKTGMHHENSLGLSVSQDIYKMAHSEAGKNVIGGVQPVSEPEGWTGMRIMGVKPDHVLDCISGNPKHIIKVLGKDFDIDSFSIAWRSKLFKDGDNSFFDDYHKAITIPKVGLRKHVTLVAREIAKKLDTGVRIKARNSANNIKIDIPVSPLAQTTDAFINAMIESGATKYLDEKNGDVKKQLLDIIDSHYTPTVGWGRDELPDALQTIPGSTSHGRIARQIFVADKMSKITHMANLAGSFCERHPNKFSIEIDDKKYNTTINEDRMLYHFANAKEAAVDIFNNIGFVLNDLDILGHAMIDGYAQMKRAGTLTEVTIKKRKIIRPLYQVLAERLKYELSKEYADEERTFSGLQKQYARRNLEKMFRGVNQTRKESYISDAFEAEASKDIINNVVSNSLNGENLSIISSLKELRRQYAGEVRFPKTQSVIPSIPINLWNPKNANSIMKHTYADRQSDTTIDYFEVVANNLQNILEDYVINRQLRDYRPIFNGYTFIKAEKEGFVAYGDEVLPRTYADTYAKYFLYSTFGNRNSSVLSIIDKRTGKFEYNDKNPFYIHLPKIQFIGTKKGQPIFGQRNGTYAQYFVQNEDKTYYKSHTLDTGWNQIGEGHYRFSAYAGEDGGQVLNLKIERYKNNKHEVLCNRPIDEIIDMTQSNQYGNILERVIDDIMSGVDQNGKVDEPTLEAIFRDKDMARAYLLESIIDNRSGDMRTGGFRIFGKLEQTMTSKHKAMAQVHGILPHLISAELLHMQERGLVKLDIPKNVELSDLIAGKLTTEITPISAGLSRARAMSQTKELELLYQELKANPQEFPQEKLAYMRTLMRTKFPVGEMRTRTLMSTKVADPTRPLIYTELGSYIYDAMQDSGITPKVIDSEGTIRNVSDIQKELSNKWWEENRESANMPFKADYSINGYNSSGGTRDYYDMRKYIITDKLSGGASHEAFLSKLRNVGINSPEAKQITLDHFKAKAFEALGLKDESLWNSTGNDIPLDVKLARKLFDATGAMIGNNFDSYAENQQKDLVSWALQNLPDYLRELQNITYSKNPTSRFLHSVMNRIDVRRKGDAMSAVRGSKLKMSLNANFPLATIIREKVINGENVFVEESSTASMIPLMRGDTMNKSSSPIIITNLEEAHMAQAYELDRNIARLSDDNNITLANVDSHMVGVNFGDGLENSGRGRRVVDEIATKLIRKFDKILISDSNTHPLIIEHEDSSTREMSNPVLKVTLDDGRTIISDFENKNNFKEAAREILNGLSGDKRQLIDEIMGSVADRLPTALKSEEMLSIALETALRQKLFINGHAIQLQRILLATTENYDTRYTKIVKSISDRLSRYAFTAMNNIKRGTLDATNTDEYHKALTYATGSYQSEGEFNIAVKRALNAIYDRSMQGRSYDIDRKTIYKIASHYDIKLDEGMKNIEAIKYIEKNLQELGIKPDGQYMDKMLSNYVGHFGKEKILIDEVLADSPDVFNVSNMNSMQDYVKSMKESAINSIANTMEDLYYIQRSKLSKPGREYNQIYSDEVSNTYRSLRGEEYIFNKKFDKSEQFNPDYVGTPMTFVLKKEKLSGEEYLKDIHGIYLDSDKNSIKIWQAGLDKEYYINRNDIMIGRSASAWGYLRNQALSNLEKTFKTILPIHKATGKDIQKLFQENYTPSKIKDFYDRWGAGAFVLNQYLPFSHLLKATTYGVAGMGAAVLGQGQIALPLLGMAGAQILKFGGKSFTRILGNVGSGVRVSTIMEGGKGVLTIPTQFVNYFKNKDSVELRSKHDIARTFTRETLGDMFARGIQGVDEGLAKKYKFVNANFKRMKELNNINDAIRQFEAGQMDSAQVIAQIEAAKHLTIENMSGNIYDIFSALKNKYSYDPYVKQFVNEYGQDMQALMEQKDAMRLEIFEHITTFGKWIPGSEEMSNLIAHRGAVSYIDKNIGKAYNKEDQRVLARFMRELAVGQYGRVTRPGSDNTVLGRIASLYGRYNRGLVSWSYDGLLKNYRDYCYKQGVDKLIGNSLALDFTSSGNAYSRIDYGKQVAGMLSYGTVGAIASGSLSIGLLAILGILNDDTANFLTSNWTNLTESPTADKMGITTPGSALIETVLGGVIYPVALEVYNDRALANRINSGKATIEQVHTYLNQATKMPGDFVGQLGMGQVGSTAFRTMFDMAMNIGLHTLNLHATDPGMKAAMAEYDNETSAKFITNVLGITPVVGSVYQLTRPVGEATGTIVDAIGTLGAKTKKDKKFKDNTYIEATNKIYSPHSKKDIERFKKRSKSKQKK